MTYAEPPPEAGTLATARAMAARIRTLRPDLVLTFNWGAIETVLGCRIAGHKALIHHEEGFSVAEADRQLRRRVWLRRLALRGAARVVVPSRRLQAIATRTWWLPPARVVHLDNGVDLARFHPRPDQGPEDDPVTIVGVASFRPVKDVPALVEAFARCHHRDAARLLLIGGGPDLERTRALAARLGVGGRVEFRGPLDDTAPAYREADVFAMSSRSEQMPLVVLEAMASGLPVVAPDVGDVRRMVADDNAELIAPAGDPDALAGRLDRLIVDRDLRRKVGAANRVVAEQRFDLDARLRDHLDLYAEVIGAPLR